MRDKLLTLLGIDSGEESVSMLLTQSIFLGIFIGAFDITAHSLLLSVFDEKMMARGYVISGITGIIFISFYVFLQGKLSYKNFTFVNLSIVSVITLLLWTATSLSSAKWIVFVVFIMFGPLNILVLKGFPQKSGSLSNHAFVKKISRRANTGVIMGILIISFTIPLLLTVKFQLQNILLVSACSLAIATGIQAMVVKKMRKTEFDEEQLNENTEVKPDLYFELHTDPFLRIFLIFAALSVLTLFFVQYTFMGATRLKYPDASDMAGFLGLFTGCLMLVTLLAKMIIFPFLLHNYGLRTCLLISSLLVGLITALAIFAGLIMGFSPEQGSGFIVFLALLALSRLFSRSLKDEIEFPSSKVIYHTLDIKFRHWIQSGNPGIISELMVIMAGVLLTLLGLLPFFRLIHFSVLLLLISFVWTAVGLKLFKEYRKAIVVASEKAAGDIAPSNILTEHNTLKNRFSAYIKFRKEYFSLISGDFSSLSAISNKWYVEEIIDSASSGNDLNLLPVLKKASNHTGLDMALRQRSAEVAGVLQKNFVSPLPEKDKLSEAQKSLSGTRTPNTTEILRLLRDSSLQSKRIAIYMIGKFRLTDLLSLVCECLNVEGLAKDAFEVLNALGPGIEKELVRFYLISSGNTRTSRIILQLLCKSCTKETAGFIFSRLMSNSRQLKEISVKCLVNCKFRPSEEEKQKLNQLISDVIRSITWYLSARVCLEKANDKFLLEKINSEIDRWNIFLFNILIITYNEGTISLIRKNLESETIESVIYALELTDIVIAPEIKSQLISLLDVAPDEEKLSNLYQFFPGAIPIRKKLLEDIINRDYNLISLWTKACTLRSITKIECDDLAESVTALLFSPEAIIREESASVIARSRPELYASPSKRLSDSVRNRLDDIIIGKAEKNDLLFEKVLFLSKNFKGIAEDELLPLASEMRYYENLTGTAAETEQDFILWTLDRETQQVRLVYGRDMRLPGKKLIGSDKISFYILSLNAIEEYQFQYPDNSYEILKYIDDIEGNISET
jgi:hypothetical protein